MQIMVGNSQSLIHFQVAFLFLPGEVVRAHATTSALPSTNDQHRIQIALGTVPSSGNRINLSLIANSIHETLSHHILAFIPLSHSLNGP